MITRLLTRSLAPALLLLVGACSSQDEASPDRPEGFASVLAIEPSSGGELQRLALPAEALVALQRPDDADLRVFDATGRAMPIALIDESAASSRSRSKVPVHAILGSRSALEVTGVTLRLDSTQTARIVGLDGKIVAPVGGETSVAGALLDTRKLEDPVDALVLDADLPAGQPVTFTLEASSNLKDWTPLAEKVLMRVADGEDVLGDRRIPLGLADLKDRYVRVRLTRPEGGSGDIRLRSAEAETVRRTARPPVVVPVRGIELVDAHAAAFVLPFATRLEGLRIGIARTDGIVPATLYARDTVEDRWHALLATTLRGEDGGTALALDPGQGSWRQFRLEADKRTPGFGSSPSVELMLPPLELVVRLGGTPPYRLATGSTAAPRTFLTPAEIAPGGKVEALSSLPRASVAATKAAGLTVDVSPATLAAGKDRRTWILWAVLVLGTLVLGYAALRLLRSAERT